ncbi:MAG: Histidine kinase [Ilumatobacteraceae bacterium]|nr:Histidine kinase [Ilumatobacteraceae bacterium]MCU1389189.1 Histidine kinase [Ilumatobacteraceae bacterium]
MTEEGPDRPPGDVDEQIERARQQARDRVGDALHDGVVQSMTALMMGLAVRRLDAPAGLWPHLDAIELELSGVVAELRDLIRDLRTPDAGVDSDRA